MRLVQGKLGPNLLKKFYWDNYENLYSAVLYTSSHIIRKSGCISR